MPDNDLISASALFDDWSSCFRSIKTTYFSVNHGDAHVIHYARIELDPVLREEASKTFSTKSIEAGVVVKSYEPDDHVRYLGWLDGKQISIQVKGVFLKFSVPTETTARFYTVRLPGFANDAQRLPSVTFTGPQCDLYEIDVLNLELLSSETPFNGISDLLSFLGIPSDFQYGREQKIDFIFDSPAMIGPQSTISGNSINLVVNASKSICKDRISVAAKVFTGTAPAEHMLFTPSEFSWADTGEISVGTLKKDIGDIIYAQCFLSYNKVWLNTYWASDISKSTNERVTAYDVFDTDRKQLDSLLHNPGSDRKNFEIGTALLLELLGFNVSHFGATKLADAPDLIAETPEKRLVVIECTTKISDLHEKNGKLLQRCSQLKEAFAGSAFGYLDILPVMFTNLPESEIKHHIIEAAKQGTLLTTKETIEDLESRLAYPVNPEAMFNEAKDNLVGMLSDKRFDN